ncbi:MAG: YggS family pyridoxal phosphate-dependent enzyme [Anaerolineae bacterium]
MADGDVIAENLQEVLDRMGEAALRAGRDPDDVDLVAVSKTFPATAILEAWAAGQRDFGENRPEEGAYKIPEVLAALKEMGASTEQAPCMPCWHMIGHIQSRKTDLVAEHFDVVHSIDRLKTARILSDLMIEDEKRIPVLIECNVSGEASKYGFDAADWEHEDAVLERVSGQIEKVLALEGLRVEGLMTMAPLVEDPEEVRWVFASLRGLLEALASRFDAVQSPGTAWHHLSMGMTDDFEVAVEEGATMVRVGRAIFGPRTW